MNSLVIENRVGALLDCCLQLIDDGCPADPAAYLCREEDADDGSACTRCWQRYVFRVANGRRPA